MQSHSLFQIWPPNSNRSEMQCCHLPKTVSKVRLTNMPADWSACQSVTTSVCQWTGGPKYWLVSFLVSDVLFSRMNIACACPKGGVSKTNIAVNMVVELYDRGLRAKYVDAEPRGPNAKSLSEFEPAIPTYRVTNYDELQLAIQDNAEQTDCVVIDLPRIDAAPLFKLCTICDFVIIPMQTSQRDLDQTKPFLKLIKAQQLGNGGSPEAALVFTYTRKGDRSAKAYRRAMAPLGIPIAQTQIRRLDHYKDNTCVMRDPRLDTKGAATDIRTLIDEIITPKLVLVGDVVHG